MKTKEKYYTSTHISREYEKLTKDLKINVLSSAIDYMEQFNGRSKFLCIAMAMGYDNHGGEINTYIKRSHV